MNSLLLTWSLADPVTNNSVPHDTKFWWVWVACLSLISLVALLAAVLIMLIRNSDKLFSALNPEKRGKTRTT